ncbi:hypothetical protein GIB67_041046 [Kingdonia uniflora]|uniref:Uncharacterized protein n=1 Tax=Kingdonia uniflora TaxID=39325 RepID=A0A7J7LGA9_9MAGN|nr:hypothetical protein GIB67_041046 [Kingdonia uniflora]
MLGNRAIDKPIDNPYFNSRCPTARVRNNRDSWIWADRSSWAYSVVCVEAQVESVPASFFSITVNRFLFGFWKLLV